MRPASTGLTVSDSMMLVATHGARLVGGEGDAPGPGPARRWSTRPRRRGRQIRPLGGLVVHSHLGPQAVRSGLEDGLRGARLSVQQDVRIRGPELDRAARRRTSRHPAAATVPTVGGATAGNAIPGLQLHGVVHEVVVARRLLHCRTSAVGATAGIGAADPTAKTVRGQVSVASGRLRPRGVVRDRLRRRRWRRRRRARRSWRVAPREPGPRQPDLQRVRRSDWRPRQPRWSVHALHDALQLGGGDGNGRRAVDRQVRRRRRGRWHRGRIFREQVARQRNSRSAGPLREHEAPRGECADATERSDAPSLWWRAPAVGPLVGLDLGGGGSRGILGGALRTRASSASHVHKTPDVEAEADDQEDGAADDQRSCPTASRVHDRPADAQRGRRGRGAVRRDRCTETLRRQVDGPAQLRVGGARLSSSQRSEPAGFGAAAVRSGVLAGRGGAGVLRRVIGRASASFSRLRAS